MRFRLAPGLVALAGSFVLAAPLVARSADAGFVATVVATHPIAYYRLGPITGMSQTGSSAYAPIGQVTPGTGCAPIVGVPSTCLMFDGKTGWLPTTQFGGIGSAGSMMAWVHLNLFPSVTHEILYVAGISQHGNDFDLQFEPDDAVHFYTAAGSNVSYAPSRAHLSGEWHLLVATFDATTKTRAIYWDGALAARDAGGGTPGKSNGFAIGESPIFTGRFFDGAMEDVALWNYALSPGTVAAIYASRVNKP